MWFAYDKKFQEVVLLASASGYVSWGMVHHYIHRDLDLEVVFEYVAIAFLGLVLIYTTVFIS